MTSRDPKKVKKAQIAVNSNSMTELRDVTCHVRSHSVTCYPTQVNASRPNPSPQAGTRFTYPGGMEGWVDLGYPAMERSESNSRSLDHKSDALPLPHTAEPLKGQGRNPEMFEA